MRIKRLDELEHYRSIWKERWNRRASGEPKWLWDYREIGWEMFELVGFPTTAEPKWKYTNVAELGKIPFEPATSCWLGAEEAREVENYLEELSPWPKLVFVNGWYAKQFSDVCLLPERLEASELRGAIFRDEEASTWDLVAALDDEVDPLSSMNAAFMGNGLFLRAPRGLVVEEPIHLIFVMAASGAPVSSHPRNLIILEPRSELHLLESTLCLGAAPILWNPVTTILVKEGAHLEQVRLHAGSRACWELSSTDVTQGRDSSYRATSLALGGRMTRAELTVNLCEPGASCQLDGLGLASGKEQVDSVTFVRHRKPHCQSHQSYKTVLDGEARGVFLGKIDVEKDAQKTVAHQTNRNLLLSKKAEINSKPQLEILADDVKCNHGATIGQLDPESIFYLRSRGLSLREARRMLVKGFASDILAAIQIDPVKKMAEVQLQRTLASNRKEEPCL